MFITDREAGSWSQRPDRQTRSLKNARLEAGGPGGWAEVPERYAAMGTFELVVFDPLRAGPVALGGPVLLQIWRRTDASTFERVYFGEGPAFSAELDAWLHPDGTRLRFADDREGTLPWLTPLERALADKERALADKERALADKDRERTLREAAERRIRELEEKLGGR